LRLKKLLPGMHKGTSVSYIAGDRAQSTLQIEVTDADRYTQFLTITGKTVVGNMTDMPWWTKQRMAVRVYSDAQMAEVICCGYQKIRFLRYPYPNKQMYNSDEKNKVNEFLGSWLKYFLEKGRKIGDIKEEYCR